MDHEPNLWCPSLQQGSPPGSCLLSRFVNEIEMAPLRKPTATPWIIDDRLKSRSYNGSGSTNNDIESIRQSEIQSFLLVSPVCPMRFASHLPIFYVACGWTDQPARCRQHSQHHLTRLSHLTTSHRLTVPTPLRVACFNMKLLKISLIPREPPFRGPLIASKSLVR